LSKGFRKAVLKHLPILIEVGSALLEPPILHVASGFSCERTQSGAYIWKVAFPLYYPTESIGLTFSDRIPHGYIPGRWNDRELAAEFVRRIEPYRPGVRALGDLSVFRRYLEESELRKLGSPFIRRAYAFTLVLLGETEEAKEQLRYLRDVTGPERSEPNFHTENAEVESALSASLESAQSLLLQWEAETRHRLGLSSMSSHSKFIN
jgi:hypothetical protein